MPKDPGLSREEQQLLNRVRQDVWTDGAKGAALFMTTTGVGYQCLKIANNRQMLGRPPVALNPNTGLAAILASGALGAFLFSKTTGMNSAHELYPIIDRRKDGEAASYRQEHLQRAKEREEDMKILQGGQTDSNSSGLFQTGKSGFVPDSAEEHVQRQKFKLSRKTSIEKTVLGDGRKGLSDSHGGHWYSYDDTSSKK